MNLTWQDHSSLQVLNPNTRVLIRKRVCSISQSSLTLCDPMDCSLQGSFVHGILQAKDTGVGCHFFLQGIFPTQGLNSSPELAGRFFSMEPPGKPWRKRTGEIIRRKGERDVKTEAEIGVTWPQAKEWQRPPEARSPFGKSSALPLPWIQPNEPTKLPASTAGRKCVSVVLSHSAFGNLFSRHRKLIKCKNLNIFPMYIYTFNKNGIIRCILFL